MSEAIHIEPDDSELLSQSVLEPDDTQRGVVRRWPDTPLARLARERAEAREPRTRGELTLASALQELHAGRISDGMASLEEASALLEKDCLATDLLAGMSLRGTTPSAQAVAAADRLVAKKGAEPHGAEALRSALAHLCTGDEARAREQLDAARAFPLCPADQALAWMLTEDLARVHVAPMERREALEHLIALTTSPNYRAELRLERAKLLGSESASLARTEFWDLARGGSTATWTALEALLNPSELRKGDLPSEDACEVRIVQARLLCDVLSGTTTAPLLGIPRWLVHPDEAVLRGALAIEGRLSRGELEVARTYLETLAQCLAPHRKELSTAASYYLTRLEFCVLDCAGDGHLAATLAQRLLAEGQWAEPKGSLYGRVARTKLDDGDLEAARVLLDEGQEEAPRDLLLWGYRFEHAMRSSDRELGRVAARFADTLDDEEAKARFLALSGFCFGVSGDLESSRSSYAQAEVLGFDARGIARAQRSIAALAGDATLYEAATLRLLSGETDESARLDLALEAFRVAYLRGDREAVRTALDALNACESGAFVAALVGVVVGATSDPSNLSTIDAAVASAPQTIRAPLALLAVLRSMASGHHDIGIGRLAKLVDEDPDPCLALLLATYHVQGGALLPASALLASLGEVDSLGDEWRRALFLQAGILRFRAGEGREGALSYFERAAALGDSMAPRFSAWVHRLLGPRTPDDALLAWEASGRAGEEKELQSLEALSLGVTLSRAELASQALETLGSSEVADIALASALASLALPRSHVPMAAMERALATLEAHSSQGRMLAAEERVRFEREGQTDDWVPRAREWFVTGGGLAAAIEWNAAAIADGDWAEERLAREAVASMLTGESRDAMLASAQGLRLVTGAGPVELTAGRSTAVGLMNLDASPPGCEPSRRVAALQGIGSAYGVDGEEAARVMRGWNLYASGDAKGAASCFEEALRTAPDDLVALEGLRVTALAEENLPLAAQAAEAIGRRCVDDARGAMFLEEAGMLFLSLPSEEQRGEQALLASFQRDPTRAVAFDKLFRRTRDRKDADRLLYLISRRLESTDDPAEIARLFWEQARALREKGDQDGALRSLENVMALEPEHVGALALLGEIAIKQSRFSDAAKALSELARSRSAPAKSRVTAGIAAADLFENRLEAPDQALNVLSSLSDDGLGTVAVRERIVRAAAKVSAWDRSLVALIGLTSDRAEPKARVEACRLAIAIAKDKLRDLARAKEAVRRLLTESPTDAEGITCLLAIRESVSDAADFLERAHSALSLEISQQGANESRAELLATVARATGDGTRLLIALGIRRALGQSSVRAEIESLASTVQRKPELALTQEVTRRLRVPGDAGPVSNLFWHLAPTLTEAFGPTVSGLGASRKERIDPRSGLAVWDEVSRWRETFQLPKLELYVGGRVADAIVGVPGDTPALVLGQDIRAPFSAEHRARVAAELYALRVGTSAVHRYDDSRLHAIIIVACQLCGISLEHPPYANLADTQKQLSKALPRAVKKQLPDLCQKIVTSPTDARTWPARARMTSQRVAAMAAGELLPALSTAFHGEADPSKPYLTLDDPRAKELLSFMLSPLYRELRVSIGLEVNRG